MKRLRNSKGLRWTCYVAIPILVLMLLISVVYTWAYNDLDYEKGKEFYQTEEFSNAYCNSILYKLRTNRNTYQLITVGDQNIYVETGSRKMYGGITNGFQYIIETPSGKIYTNIHEENLNSIKQQMSNQKIYWNYEDGKINTSIRELQIPYLIDIRDFEGYHIYTMFDESKISVGDDIYYQKLLYDAIENWGFFPCYSIPILILLLFVIGIYLLYAIGNDKEELASIHFVPYELVGGFCFFIIGVLLTIFAIIGNQTKNIVLLFNMGLIVYILCYIPTAFFTITTIKRIKAKQFFKSFFIYRILRWIKHKLAKPYTLLVYEGSVGKKLTIRYIGFILISLVLANIASSGIGWILLFAFWGWSWYALLKYAKQCYTIEEALGKIYQGKTDVTVNTQELKGMLKQMAIYVNDIAGGFSNAVEQSLKSERLKTELITNVSHDIKTPLTSIINYVDLLKKENIQDEKIKEYLAILDQKSQRLKRLIEDLVEASKVSSGNVTLHKEKMNVKELMKQTIGEFKDRWEEKKLQVEWNLPKEEVYILADNQYMYRVIENLYSNITKYALEGSRVYLDVIQQKEKVRIELKNISKEKLNISVEELMQRFVRGDKARSTEGSGLGISISKSLTELQSGTFTITIDGDLFKVVLEFKLA